MISREQLLRSSDYWFESFQNDLYGQVISYMETENINQTELASRLGVSKGYISQILNGNFNHSIKKLIDLSLAIDCVPMIKYKKIDAVLVDDFKSKIMYSSTYSYDEVLYFPYKNGECQHSISSARTNPTESKTLKVNADKYENQKEVA